MIKILLLNIETGKQYFYYLHSIFFLQTNFNIVIYFYDSRFGSLDRRPTRSSSSRSNSSVDHEPPVVPMPHYTNPQHIATTVLLPNQMYPENSLMRTHSLGNIKNENQQQTEKSFTDLDQVSLVAENRKNSEKKWLETSLDSSSVESGPILTHDLPPPLKMHTPPLIPQPDNKHQHTFEPLVNHFDNVIIF